MQIQGHTILFKTIVGSQAYGTNIEKTDTQAGSDIDYKGVFIQDPYDKYMNGYRDELTINKDEKYFELEKFLLLCSTGKPTILEMLFAPKHCIVHITDIFKEILEFKCLFLTKNLRHSFGNYAKEQIRKASGLDKKMNWEKSKTERKTVEDMCSILPFSAHSEMFINNAIKLNEFLMQNNFLIENCGLCKIEHFRDCYLLFNSIGSGYRGITSGENANDVCLSEIKKDDKPVGVLFFHKDSYSQHCKYYKEYRDWLEKRNTDRYVDIEGHGQQIDGKNILHNIRIIETAMEIPIDKTINIFRPNREYLINIRHGKYDLQSLMDKSESDLKVMYELFENSDLPDNFEHQNYIKDFIEKSRNNFFKLHTI